MGAAEQITAARMPQKGTTLQVKMKAGGYGGRVIGGWVMGYGLWVMGDGLWVTGCGLWDIFL